MMKMIPETRRKRGARKGCRNTKMRGQGQMGGELYNEISGNRERITYEEGISFKKRTLP